MNTYTRPSSPQLGAKPAARETPAEPLGKLRLILLEDDEETAGQVMTILDDAGYSCEVARSGTAMLSKLRRESFDMLLLDWEVPGPTGIEILAWARKTLEPGIPIMMLTGRTADTDLVAGLEAGADDYIGKPIHKSVFLARVAALLRRSHPRPVATSEVFGSYVFDLQAQRITDTGHEIGVTAKEFALALMLFRNLNRPLSRGHLTDTIWGHTAAVQSRTLDTHVSAVRSKLGLRPERGFILSSVYSFGYRLDEHELPDTAVAPR